MWVRRPRIRIGGEASVIGTSSVAALWRAFLSMCDGSKSIGQCTVRSSPNRAKMW